MPVSLTPGHIRTPEFEINTQSSYRIAFVARRGFGHQPGPTDPPDYQYCLPDLGVSWSLSNQGRVVANNTGQMCDALGEVQAGSGRYVLDVHVSRDGSRFNAFGPHLMVFEVGGEQETVGGQGFWAFWGLIVLASLGTGAVVCSAIRSRHEKSDSFFKAWPLTLPQPQLAPPRTDSGAPRREAIATRRAPIVTEYYLGDRRASARRPLTGLSSIALMMLLTYFIVVVAMWSAYWFPLIPVGFKVRLLRPGVAAQASPGIQPIIVRVACEKRTASDGQRRPLPTLWVNRKLVAREDFETVLQKELNLRPPHWPVYLEGDSEMDWQHAVQVIDIVQKLHAQVVLLTSRAERR